MILAINLKKIFPSFRMSIVVTVSVHLGLGAAGESGPMPGSAVDRKPVHWLLGWLLGTIKPANKSPKFCLSAWLGF